MNLLQIIILACGLKNTPQKFECIDYMIKCNEPYFMNEVSRRNYFGKCLKQWKGKDEKTSESRRSGK